MYRKDGPRVVQGGNQFSALGTAIHKVFELYTSLGITPTVEQVQEVAHSHNVPMKGYYGLAWRVNLVAEKWKGVAQYFTDPQREVELSAVASNGYPITGHPDLLQVWNGYAVIADLKSGEVEGIDHFAQGMWYAWLVWKTYQVEKVFVIIFAPMLDVWETRQYTMEQLIELENQFEEWCMQAGHIYSGPNAMCRFCPNATDCPAISRAVDPLVTEFSQIQARGRELTPDDVRQMRPMMKQFAKWAEQFHEAEKILVERFGPIDLGDGTQIQFVNDTRTEFKPVETVDILEAEGIPRETTIAEMKISKDSIKALARVIAVPRSRTHGIGVLQKRFLEVLEAKGATDEKPYRRLVVRNLSVVMKPQSQEAI